MTGLGRVRSDFGKVALIGNHTPRRCGIATFTADLAEALAQAGARDRVLDRGHERRARRLRATRSRSASSSDESSLTDYRLAAEFLNMNQVDVACLQHEYGIFGGPTAATSCASSASCACRS